MGYCIIATCYMPHVDKLTCSPSYEAIIFDIYLFALLVAQKNLLFVSPAKHGQHIGIISPLSSSSMLLRFWLPIANFEGMHQFHLNFTEG